MENLTAGKESYVPANGCILSTSTVEFEKGETPEGKIARALDKMEAVIQHNESPLSTWIPDEYELNRTYGWDKAAFSPYLTALRQEMLEDTEKKIAAGLDGEPMKEY